MTLHNFTKKKEILATSTQIRKQHFGLMDWMVFEAHPDLWAISGLNRQGASLI